MKSVYIFRGAPATGKGTLAPEFCKLLPKPVALIEQDVFRWGFHLIGRKVSEVEDTEHLFAYQNMLLIYEQYLKSRQYDIVLEGLFTWDDDTSSQGYAKRLVEMAHSYGFSVKSVVLRADKEELLRRNNDRQYSVPSDEFDLLYENIYKKVNDSELVIDSTGQSIERTLSLLKTVI
jgi:predicted kinase